MYLLISLQQNPFTPLALLLGLSAARLLMLLAATVISVYNPWGTLRLGTQIARPALGTLHADRQQ